MASCSRNETPKPVLVKRFQNQPPNKSTYMPLPIPSYQERETIYLAIRDKGLLRKSGPMKVPTNRRNQYKYCHFHEDVRHNTSECYSLRNQIEWLVRGGLPTEFLQKSRRGNGVQSEIQEAADRRMDGEKNLMQQI
ncbi:hypothetical protein QYF36_002356 [Acer negundo]|nr:hypothetical protein QYF36_002356 [Acer negundo]